MTLFFPSAGVFNLADSVWSVVTKQPLITLIIKAKSNCTAYFETEKIQEKKPGRPPKYGEKVVLAELFDQLHLFSKIPCTIYGKFENVSILTVDLLWKPIGRLIRLILAVNSHGPIEWGSVYPKESCLLIFSHYSAKSRNFFMCIMLNPELLTSQRKKNRMSHNSNVSKIGNTIACQPSGCLCGE